MLYLVERDRAQPTFPPLDPCLTGLIHRFRQLISRLEDDLPVSGGIDQTSVWHIRLSGGIEQDSYHVVSAGRSTTYEESTDVRPMEIRRG